MTLPRHARVAHGQCRAGQCPRARGPPASAPRLPARAHRPVCWRARGGAGRHDGGGADGRAVAALHQAPGLAHPGLHRHDGCASPAAMLPAGPLPPLHGLCLSAGARCPWRRGGAVRRPGVDCAADVGAVGAAVEQLAGELSALGQWLPVGRICQGRAAMGNRSRVLAMLAPPLGPCNRCIQPHGLASSACRQRVPQTPWVGRDAGECPDRRNPLKCRHAVLVHTAGP